MPNQVLFVVRDRGVGLALIPPQHLKNARDQAVLLC
jgi:hypothetical protein